MKLAIPLFGTRISPRFDCAPALMLVTLENGEVVKKERLLLGGLNPLERIAKLSEIGANVVICGAIDGFSHSLLIQRGIRIYSWVTGDAEKALKLFINGDLQPGIIIMPGGKRGCWRFRRGAKWKW